MSLDRAHLSPVQPLGAVDYVTWPSAKSGISITFPAFWLSSKYGYRSVASIPQITVMSFFFPAQKDGAESYGFLDFFDGAYARDLGGCDLGPS